MDRLIMVVWFILNMFSFTTVYADYQGDALTALKNSCNPKRVFERWDNTEVNPCSWPRITCNGSNVIRVDLGNVGLSGKLVPELGKLDKLQYLEIYKNKIYGSIPRELGNLVNLVSLDLYHNQLTGPIPPELGNLNVNKLRFLRLQNNNLCGRIPVHALARLIHTSVDTSKNPRLCTDFTIPKCPKVIKCP